MATRKRLDAILMNREEPKTIDEATGAARLALRYARRERDNGHRDTMQAWLNDAAVLADWVMERTTSEYRREAMCGTMREAAKIAATKGQR